MFQILDIKMNGWLGLFVVRVVVNFILDEEIIKLLG